MAALYETENDAEASESDSDNDMACIGFMFDTARKKGCECFEFHNSKGELFTVDLNMIQGDPGHVQSGQYLWPAAHYAVSYLADHVDEFNHLCKNSSEAISIVELGAGCGLTALGVSQLFPHRLISCILTDRDYGSLLLLEQNSTQLWERLSAQAFPMHKSARMREIAATAQKPGIFASDKESKGGDSRDNGDEELFPLFTTAELNWGKPLPEELYKRCCKGSIYRCLEASSTGSTAVATGTQTQAAAAGLPFQLLLLGSDLLYSEDVVAPLLTTVVQLLTLHSESMGSSKRGVPHLATDADMTGIFILTSSFDIGENINLEVSQQADKLKLEIREMNALNVSTATCRVQQFRLKQ